MACNKCKNRKFAKSTNQQLKLLSAMISGFCRIRVKTSGKTKYREYVCTRNPELLPQPGSEKYRTDIVYEPGVSAFTFWSINKNLKRTAKPEAGWVTIKVSDIIYFESIGKSIEDE